MLVEQYSLSLKLEMYCGKRPTKFSDKTKSLYMPINSCLFHIFVGYIFLTIS